MWYATTLPPSPPPPLIPIPEVVVAPPALYLLLAQQTLRPEVKVAAQNIYDKGNGAYTGEISPQQLKDANVEWVLLGHSERRAIFTESDAFVASKTKAALDNGLSVILCCGESLEEREAGTTIQVVTRQLAAVAEIVKDWSKIVVAYEPVWAIGTGKVATTEQAQEAHKGIREWMKKTVGALNNRGCGRTGRHCKLSKVNNCGRSIR